MTRSNLLVLLAVAVVAAGFWMLQPTQAQQAAPAGRCGVAVVNIPLIFSTCKETADMDKALSALKDSLTKDMNSQNERLRTLQEALQHCTPDSQDFKDKSNELLAERIRMRVSLEEQQRNLLLQQQMRAEKFYGKIVAAVAAIAQANGYDVVLYHEEINFSDAKTPEQLLDGIRERKVVYNSLRSDITKQVIDRLDIEYGAAPK